jgi:hypothetical protein
MTVFPGTLRNYTRPCGCFRSAEVRYDAAPRWICRRPIKTSCKGSITMARLFGTLAVVLALSSSLFASQTLTVADLGVFAGEWTLTLDSPQGPFEQSLAFKDEGGKAVAELHNEMLGTTKVTDISKDGDNVVLKYAGNFQGNPFDAAVTLTPDGTDKCKVTFDVNAGQFSMSGTGTKK